MNCLKLTNSLSRAHKVAMRGSSGRRLKAMAMVGAIPLVSGCISLEAPTEPIVIELNINITQEVIYRLADDASNAIEENADIF